MAEAWLGLFALASMRVRRGKVQADVLEQIDTPGEVGNAG